MPPHKRFSFLPPAFVFLVGAFAALIFLRTEREPSRPFVPQAPPQRAVGDFDGDGLIDTALVQDRAGDRHVSIQLSRSASAVRLDAAVTGVIGSDVDHDGDLDLVAATPSGDVLIWLNDGHGRFTRQAASTGGRSLSGAPVLVQAPWSESMAIGTRAPSLISPAHGQVLALVTSARAPTRLVAPALQALVLVSPRAPPPRSL